MESQDRSAKPFRLICSVPDFLILLLEFNCFAVLCSFLLHQVNQLYVYMYPLCLEPPTLPSRPLGHRSTGELPALCSCLPLAVKVFQMVVTYVSAAAQLVPPSPSHPISTCPLSTSSSPFLPADRFSCAIFLDSIYMH
ncbi:unnamed protein product [Rangifer tarandus platyrhynchus]|uniref:Uncharacterized protein n=2 Tax=Rangifer tarandus platyrhynchus TaxID=3082113 RepID=A0AC59ZAS2_RANTA|nr:unnamed protein product [Rangifer tarandus platyrhynchus]